MIDAAVRKDGMKEDRRKEGRKEAKLILICMSSSMGSRIVIEPLLCIWNNTFHSRCQSLKRDINELKYEQNRIIRMMMTQ